MRTFIAYRFTGEDPDQLEPLLAIVRDAFNDKGIESYCTFFDEEKFQHKSKSARQIMEHAFEVVNNSDFLFVLLTSENKSEGLLMEVGYCIAKGVPIVVANKASVSNTYIPEMAVQCFTWEDTAQLAYKINKLDLANLKS